MAPFSREESAGRDVYYDAALANMILRCDECPASLDPDSDLGPNLNFASERYYVLLGNEAQRQGWRITRVGSYFDYTILCPQCAARATS